MFVVSGQSQGSVIKVLIKGLREIWNMLRPDEVCPGFRRQVFHQVKQVPEMRPLEIVLSPYDLRLLRINSSAVERSCST